MHRFVWDLRYPTPPALDFDRDGRPSDSISYGIIAPAIRGASPRQQPLGPLVLPGAYRITVTADGASASRTLRVVNDPRSTASASGLARQVEAERGLSAAIARVHDAVHNLRMLADGLHRQTGGAAASTDVRPASEAFERALSQAFASLAGGRALVDQLSEVDQGDAAPTPSTAAAIDASCARADAGLTAYRKVTGDDLSALNRALSAAGLTPLAAPPPLSAKACQIE
jgi:hypothetical protein